MSETCLQVLRELEEDLPISSEDEWYEIRALLIDLYGHGVRGHARLKRLLFSSVINRRLASQPRDPCRASYHSWGNGVLNRLIERNNR
ncbi:hypothetical protein SB748_25660 [Rhizobium sp. SIMBA_035]